MNRRFISRLFFWLLLFSSCFDDHKTISQSIEGRWEIVRGLRNGQETGTLLGTYFRFGADGKMITNLPVGPEAPVEYELGKSTIYQKSVSPIEYSIRSLSDSSMVLGFELRGMQFELYLTKAESVETLPEPENTPENTSDTLPADSIEG